MAQTSTDLPTDVLALTTALAQIDSINPTLVPGAAGEAEVGAYVESWMRNQGWDVTTEQVSAERPNVVARIRGGSGPTLLINGHLDTVGASTAAQEIRREGDRLRGRGVLDTKGGLAAAMSAAAALATPPPGDIVIAAVSDEENASIGTEALLLTETADASIVLEPTDLTIGVRHRGLAVLEASFRGRSAHTAHRDEGRNAIDAAFRMAGRLAALDEQFGSRESGSSRELTTVQVTQIRGGTEIFTVPDRCTAIVEIRTVAPLDQTDLAAVRSAITDDTSEGIGIESTLLQVRPPLATDAASRIAECMRDGVVAGGGTGEYVALPFWTDAALQSVASIPSVVFGPGGGGIHSEDEYVLIADLEACRHALLHVMERFGAS